MYAMTTIDLPSSESFREAFAQADATQPVVLWRPAERDFRDPLILRFARLCDTLREPEGHVSLERFQNAALDDLADYVARAEPCDASPDFHFLSFGQDLYDTRGRDLTGRTTGVLDPHLRSFLNGLFAAAMRSGFRVLSIHEPVQKVFASDRISLTVPLFDASGTAVQVAVMTVNENALRPGLDALPDPALVVQPDQRVVYANGQAEAIYGRHAFMTQAISLEDYCGFALDLDPDRVSDRIWMREIRTRTVLNGVIVTSRVTARKVTFRNQPFLVVVIRPE